MTWTPQPGPQAAFVASEAFEVIYGGARGGGKTDAALGEFALHARAHGANACGLLIRRTRSALEPTLARARQIFVPEGAAWREARSRFEWPSGAVLYFRYLDNDADADLYQGHSYTRVYVEELDTYLDSTGYQFALDQGLDSVAQSKAAAGMLGSGSLVRALDAYGTGLADQYGQQYAADLQGVVGTGAGAADALAGQGQSYAGQVSANNNAAASAAENADYSAANAFNGALGTSLGAISRGGTSFLAGGAGSFNAFSPIGG